MHRCAPGAPRCGSGSGGASASVVPSAREATSPQVPPRAGCFSLFAFGNGTWQSEPEAGKSTPPARFMLVLTRKSNQSIMIGDDIEVSVLSIMGEKVRIGIQAPRDIPVFRKEVYLEIQE